VGGYQDWLRQGGSPRLLGVGETKAGKAELASAVVEAAPAPAPEAAPDGKAPAAKKKLSYKVQRELEALPAQIDALEVEIAALEAQIGAPAFYQQSAEKSAEVLARLQHQQDGLDKLLERWAELEG
jgi:ATP-binding cassette subfamily F protein uup